MKRFLFFALAVIMFAACSKDAINEQQSIQNIVDEAPETITVGFEGDETRIQLNSAQKTVWTKDDLVSVFYRSNANQQWKYDGETGERTAELKRVDAGTATHDMDRVVVVYPYKKDYYINPKTYNVQASLPAVQNYLKDSYGTNGNIMISSSEYNQFSLKSVCGWLKLQLTGDGEVVKSITLRGNNGEQVAGELYINSADATSILASESGATDDDSEAGGSLIFEDTILKEVTLDCGEGVELGAEATAFYIALPPQTFDGGITVEIATTDGATMTKSTDKSITIERNCIQPMAEFGYNGVFKPANNEIYYTNGSTTAPTAPNNTAAFGDATIQSNTYDAEKECWVITFDKEVTAIGYYAFYNCTSLTSVTIPDSVTTIGGCAFEHCESLTSVTIPDSLTTIREEAFCSCSSLTSVTIGNSVTTIGDFAFSSCTSLTSVTIPDSVTTIGYWAFYACTSLTSVTIPDSVTTIGEYAFFYCKSLKEFKGKFAADGGRCLIIDGVLNAFAIGCGVTQYTIPDSVTTIGVGAFYNCDSLTSVTIGDSVTSIGNGAFENCYSLTSVTIPDSVTTIGYSAFSFCYSLTSVTIPDSVTTIGEAAFEQCTSLTSVTIPDSVMTIGWGAFRGCSSLTSVTIPDSVTTIEGSTFGGCYSLTSVTIPDSVTTIGEVAFDGCYSLTSVTIPDSVTTIGSSAFSFCGSLTSVTIGNSVTTIGDSAFYYCSSLKSVTIGNSVTTIGGGAFRDCDSLTSVTIPDSVTTIGDSAFNDCDSLTSVTIPDSVTTIGGGAFSGCDSLKEFKGKFAADGGRCLIIDGVLNAFAIGCGVTQYTIPESVTTIGEEAFNWCTSLTSVIIPDSVTAIGEEAFNWCTSLTSVIIPDSVTTIEAAAFRACDSLTSVYCKPTTPPTLNGSSAFDYNGSGRKIYVPAGSVDAYKGATNWSEYASAIVGYDFETGVVVE